MHVRTDCDHVAPRSVASDISTDVWPKIVFAIFFSIILLDKFTRQANKGFLPDVEIKGKTNGIRVFVYSCKNEIRKVLYITLSDSTSESFHVDFNNLRSNVAQKNVEEKNFFF